MNIQHKKGSLVPETVTTGPLPGSRKVYYTPKDFPDVHVPYREIELTDKLEPPLRVYDPSGPYTETNAAIDLARGLPRIRDPWIARRNANSYAGRAVKPVDNGDVANDKLVPRCPAVTEPRAAAPGQLITQ